MLADNVIAVLGERLAASRRRAGLSQFQLALALDCDRTLISHLEVERVGISADKLSQAAKTLNVSIDYLAGLTDEPRPAAELAANAVDLELLRDAIEAVEKVLDEKGSEMEPRDKAEFILLVYKALEENEPSDEIPVLEWITGAA